MFGAWEFGQKNKPFALAQTAARLPGLAVNWLKVEMTWLASMTSMKKGKCHARFNRVFVLLSSSLRLGYWARSQKQVLWRIKTKPFKVYTCSTIGSLNPFEKQTSFSTPRLSRQIKRKKKWWFFLHARFFQLCKILQWLSKSSSRSSPIVVLIMQCFSSSF